MQKTTIMSTLGVSCDLKALKHLKTKMNMDYHVAEQASVKTNKVCGNLVKNKRCYVTFNALHG